MKKLKMDLQLFDDPTGHSITVVYDSHISSAVVKNTSSQVLTDNVPENTDCILKVTFATGYQIKEILCLQGIDRIRKDVVANTWSFRMPAADVVIAVVSMKTGLTITVIKDDGVQTVSPEYYEGLTEGAEVTVSRTMKSGYSYAGCEILGGGVKVTEETSGSTFLEMGSADATVVIKSKPSNGYVVNENVLVNVNNHKLLLKKNTKLIPSKSGAIYDVEYADGAATQIDESQYAAAIEGLVKAGVLVKA